MGFGKTLRELFSKQAKEPKLTLPVIRLAQGPVQAPAVGPLWEDHSFTLNKVKEIEGFGFQSYSLDELYDELDARGLVFDKKTENARQQASKWVKWAYITKRSKFESLYDFAKADRLTPIFRKHKYWGSPEEVLGLDYREGSLFTKLSPEEIQARIAVFKEEHAAFMARRSVDQADKAVDPHPLDFD